MWEQRRGTEEEGADCETTGEDGNGSREVETRRKVVTRAGEVERERVKYTRPSSASPKMVKL